QSCSKPLGLAFRRLHSSNKLVASESAVGPLQAVPPSPPVTRQAWHCWVAAETHAASELPPSVTSGCTPLGASGKAAAAGIEGAGTGGATATSHAAFTYTASPSATSAAGQPTTRTKRVAWDASIAARTVRPASPSRARIATAGPHARSSVRAPWE